MAEEAVTEVPESITEETAKDMELETQNRSEKSDVDEVNAKRGREEEGEPEKEEDNGGESNKQKVDKSVEEQRLEKSETAIPAGPVSVGAKSFATSVEIFDYFFKFLHFWPPNLNVNKYEQLMLLDLLKKGHQEPEKKIGNGVRAFQVRYHPQWKSRCFFLIREDESSDDFSFRKCVDHILPLPESMRTKSDVNKALGGGKSGGGGRGGGRGNWRGRGRDGKPRC